MQPHIVTIWFGIYFMHYIWWNTVSYNCSNNTSRLYIWAWCHFKNIRIFALKHASRQVSGSLFIPSEMCGWMQCSPGSVSRTIYYCMLFNHLLLSQPSWQTWIVHSYHDHVFTPHPVVPEWFVNYLTSASVQVCFPPGLHDSRKYLGLCWSYGEI